jgi:hypothetical protein
MGLDFDDFDPRAGCILGLIAALAIFERRLIVDLQLDAAPTLTLSGFIASAHAYQLHRQPGAGFQLLDAYFLNRLDPRKTGLTKRNSKEVTPVIAKFIGDLLENRYFRDGAPMARARIVLPPSDPLRRLADKLAGYAGVNHPTLQADLDRSSPEGGDKAKAVERFLGIVFGPEADGVMNPDYRSVPLLHIPAIKVENHSYTPTDPNTSQIDPNSGMFALIREARGWSVKEKVEINLLVRDLIWIAPPHKQSTRAPKNANVCRGFYFSVIDNGAFVLEDVQQDRESIIALGKLDRPGGSIQRTRVEFFKFQHHHQLQMGHGIVAGTTGDPGDPTFAAWKTLVIRPNWPDHHKLEGMLSQYEAKDVAKTYGVLSDAAACCILFSSLLRSQVPDVQRRRMTFRKLIASDTDLMRNRAVPIGDFLSHDLEK